MKRRVNFSTLFGLFKSKQPYGILSIVFIVIAVFFLPFTFIFPAAFKGENDNYDVSGIKKYGSQQEAVITYIKTVSNLTINEEHPVVISYEYQTAGNKVKDKFETLDFENIASFKIGTPIKIMVYKGQSIIKGIERYSFPAFLFFLIPIVLFVTGIILFLIALTSALKTYSLYRNGVIKEAVIVATDFGNAIGALTKYKKSVAVNYYFMDEHQNKVFGEFESKDFLFLMNKKEGDKIKIFVAENDFNKSCLVPNLEAARNNWNLNITTY
jgi:hypothetical protein